jgi:quinoprotein glucose dehydrogenase
VKQFASTFAATGSSFPWRGQADGGFPGFDGGAEWGGPAIDPLANVLYVNANEMAWTGGLIPAAHGGSPGARSTRASAPCAMASDRGGAPPAFPSLVGVLDRLTVEKVTDNVKKGNGRMPSFPNIDDAHWLR